jgi:hypothetical protein
MSIRYTEQVTQSVIAQTDVVDSPQAGKLLGKQMSNAFAGIRLRPWVGRPSCFILFPDDRPVRTDRLGRDVALVLSPRSAQQTEP